jgi:enoyl-CoA hydratase/carnithine racemase
MTVSTAYRDGVAIVGFANPPVNAISVGRGLVAALRGELERVIRKADVQAIVVKSDGRFFSAGADISDFDERAGSGGRTP